MAETESTVNRGHQAVSQGESKQIEPTVLRQVWKIDDSHPAPYVNVFALQANPNEHEYCLHMGFINPPLPPGTMLHQEPLEDLDEVEIISVARVIINPLRLRDLHEIVTNALRHYVETAKGADESEQGLS